TLPLNYIHSVCCFFYLQVQQAFSDLERERGYLVTDEVFEALVKIGFSLDSPAFYIVCESFDQKKNGRFRLDDFISICIFLQSARNMFDSFDTAKQGRVTLDLNQFVYCIRERKKRKERKTTPALPW
ncbi:uncharacterized protein LOC133814109, partial [Humulus lupulus]|uniref:uncharacterized protein LOC133814109 n=1 Tax=Humulus lupulus TaxID=3486 RepID=UPI002B415BAD